MPQKSVRRRVFVTVAAVALWVPVLTAVCGCTRAGKDAAKAPPAIPKPLPVGLDEFEMKVPADNPLTPEKVKLVWHLYFDKRLSADGTVACVTCHAAEHGWSDGKPLMVGIRNGCSSRIPLMG